MDGVLPGKYCASGTPGWGFPEFNPIDLYFSTTYSHSLPYLFSVSIPYPPLILFLSLLRIYSRTRVLFSPVTVDRLLSAEQWRDESAPLPIPISKWGVPDQDDTLA